MSNWILPFILYSIPESIALLYCASIFLGEKPRARMTIFGGMLLALVIYLFRSITGEYGLHTIIGFIFLAFLTSSQFERSKLESTVAALKTMILIVVIETAVIYSISSYLGYPAEMLYQEKFLWFGTLPQALILMLFARAYLWYMANKQSGEKKSV